MLGRKATMPSLSRWQTLVCWLYHRVEWFKLLKLSLILFWNWISFCTLQRKIDTWEIHNAKNCMCSTSWNFNLSWMVGFFFNFLNFLILLYRRMLEICWCLPAIFSPFYPFSTVEEAYPPSSYIHLECAQPFLRYKIVIPYWEPYSSNEYLATPVKPLQFGGGLLGLLWLKRQFPQVQHNHNSIILWTRANWELW